MNKKILISLTAIILLTSLISAAPTQEVNFSGSSDPGITSLQITQLRYEPFPVNPGEYFDLWIKAQWVGSSPPRNVQFELDPKYPFSLDPSEDSIRTFGIVNNEPIVLKYKVRVNDDAVEGINDLDLRYNTDNNPDYWKVKTLDIQVADAQTDFDMVIQESTGTDVSIAIANTGTNTANSLIVRIPKQDNFQATGTNGQMVGNLDAGDYTIVSFALTEKNRNADSLQVQLDYTDNIGVRRSVIKNVDFVSSSPVGNFTGRSGNFTRGNFQRNTSANTQTSSNFLSNIWFWIFVVIISAVIYFNRKRIMAHYHARKLKSGKDSGEVPDWVSAERKKK